MDTKYPDKVSCFMELRACTLRVTFVAVIGLGLFVSALVVCLEVYGQKLISHAQGDSVLNQVSNNYCKGVEIVAVNGSNFNAYLMPKKPGISSKKLAYSNGKEFYMPSWTYQYWGAFFLKGSVVDIYICSDQYIMFYIIKGLKSFHEWKQTTLYRSYYQTNRLYPKEKCKERSHFYHFRLTAKETDMFYIMFSSSVGWRFYTKVTLLLKFERNIYNTSGAIDVCSSQDQNGTCYLPLEYNSENAIVVEHTSPQNAMADFFKTSKIKWKPSPRLSYYAKFFGGIFMCIVLMTIVYSTVRCIMKLHQKRSKKYAYLMKNHGRREQRTRKLALPRRATRTTLASYEVVNQSEINEDEEENERRLSLLNEEFNASTTYTSTDQVRDLSMTAAGISAI